MHPEAADCTLGGGPSYSVFAKVNWGKYNNITRILYYLGLWENDIPQLYIPTFIAN